MIREAIAKVVDGQNLSRAEAMAVMEEIMTGQATPAQWGALMTGLRLKGETVDEIAGFAAVMRRFATPVATSRAVVDTCGTGGDGRGTFNVSTTAAFVAAGAGATIAKHGNRSMTSRCGSADVLEALGVNIALTPEQVQACMEEAGIGFMFAQLFHPAMKFAAGPRREIGIRTVFNVLGPLTNPAGARAQVLGVPSAALVSRLAEALALLGTHHALVVHGEDGLDEISLATGTQVHEARDGDVRSYRIEPANFGLEAAPTDAIRGGTVDRNVAIARAILDGQAGPTRDVVLLNAGAALYVAGISPSIPAGIRRAAEELDSGRVREKVEQVATASQRIKTELATAEVAGA
jgi:anthranilate phosphoribosyltransferase